MQTVTVKANGQRTSLTPHCDALIIDLEGGRMSVEYAKARTAINQDFKLNFAGNQPLAKRIRKQSKETLLTAMGGVVSKNPEGNLIVTFTKDGSVARL